MIIDESRDVQSEGDNTDGDNLHGWTSVSALGKNAHQFGTHRSIIHVFLRYRPDSGEREDHADKQCPCNTDGIKNHAQPPIAHVERTRFKHHIRMFGVQPSAEDRNDIAQIQCYGGK